MSKLVSILVILISVGVLVSGVAGGIAAATVPASPGWAMIGFESVIVLASIIGVLFGVGRFRNAPGLALACVAGTVFVGSVLGYIGVQGVLGEMGLRTALMARLLAAAVLGGLAVVMVLRLRPASLGTIVIGGVMASVALAGGAGAYQAFQGKWGPFAPLSGSMAIVRDTGVAIGGLVLAVLFAVGVHLVIRGFELCREAPTHTPKP